jgi:phosphohistidine phosphatase
VRLYLVQHGQATSEEEDPRRPLTERGLADVGRVASHAVEQLGIGAARLVHSGKTRARQTAEVWGGLLRTPVDQANALAPNDDPAAWAKRLESEMEDLVLVGHLPHLDRLAALLLTGTSTRSVIAFRPGGLVGLCRTDAGWVVTVVLPPQEI